MLNFSRNFGHGPNIYCGIYCVCEIPQVIRAQAEANIKAAEEAEDQRIANKRRKVITDELYVVDLNP